MRPTAQVEHVAPTYPVQQVHTHAVLAALITTDVAWLLQCVPTLHWVFVEQPTVQVPHVAPVHPVKQVHTHAVLAAFITTDVAWLLQCMPTLH